MERSAPELTPRPLSRLERVLVGMELFLALGAFSGAVGLISGGVDLGEVSTDLPFASPAFGGVALAVLNGLLPTVVAVAALRRARWAGAGHLVVGTVLVAWIVIQIAFIGLIWWLQVVYLAYGVVLQALALQHVRRADRARGLVGSGRRVAEHR